MNHATQFLAPTSIEEVLAVLEDKGPRARILAGGTDLMVRVRRGTLPPSVLTLVSLTRVRGLRGVSRDEGRLVLGPATTATDLIRDPLVKEHAPILATVAGRMASAQIRNVATIGGNLANASPAGDLIVPLLLLDAEVELRSSGGERSVPVSELFLGPGATVLRPGELLFSIRFPIPTPGRVFGFEKAGTRPSMECSVLTVGLACSRSDSRLRDVRVAFGSAAPTPLLGRATEAVLEGARPTPEVVDRAVQIAMEEVEPISDVRGGAEYRRALAGEFLRRLVDGLHD